MAQLQAAYYRDANRVPITTDGLITTDSQTFTGNNTTIHTPIFTITGTVEIRGIWGQVTTVLGANHTAANFRLNDGGAQVAITAAGGTTLSGVAAGSMIVKKDVNSAAVTLINNSAGRISEPTTLETTYFSPFVMTAKTGATTNIEYSYTTTDTPTSGAMTFFLRWLPISTDANVTPL